MAPAIHHGSLRQGLVGEFPLPQTPRRLHFVAGSRIVSVASWETPDRSESGMVGDFRRVWTRAGMLSWSIAHSRIPSKSTRRWRGPRNIWLCLYGGGSTTSCGFFYPTNEFADGDLNLKPRERAAKTEVDTATVANMLVVLAFQVNLVRVLEPVGVAVSGPVHDDDRRLSEWSFPQSQFLRGRCGYARTGQTIQRAQIPRPQSQ